MSQKHLALALQSSHEALLEGLEDLTQALDLLESLERDGLDLPIPPSTLERARAACLTALRGVESARTRLPS